MDLFYETLEHKMRLINQRNKTNQEEIERNFLFMWYPSLNQIDLITSSCFINNRNNLTNLTGESCLDIYFNAAKTSSIAIETNKLPILLSFDQNKTKGN